MSDLDADLYGGNYPVIVSFSQLTRPHPDLYGNEEADYTEQPEVTSKTESETEPSVKEATPPVKPAPQADTTPPNQEQEQFHTEESSAPNGDQDQENYDEQATQQIPTYQERQTPEYRDPSAARGDAGFAGAQNRPVRPSEMKEEG